MKDFVNLIASLPDDSFSDGQMTEAESRSRWASITMNLAFMLSKCRKLNTRQLDESFLWLSGLIEDKIGGAEEATAEVCKFAHATLVRNH